MRKLVFLIVTIAALAIAAPALAGTTNVNVTANGFSPDEVTIQPGDTVTWKNTDTVNHQVVSDTGQFRSDTLRPGESFSFVFATPSSYSYHDGMKADRVGYVHVQSTKVTIGISRIRAVYNEPVRVFGSVPNGGSSETVTLHITPYRGQEITRTVVTDNDGTYETTIRPTIRTELSATWNGTTSERAPIIGVRPLVIFRPLNRARTLFFVRIRAARSYARKLVRIQRLNSKGVWVTTERVRMNRFGQRTFTLNFPQGTTRARAWVTRSPGYTVGFSTTKLITR
jgi:plastocyanin